MEEKPFVSPFSLRRHEWKVEWRVQSERPVNRDMQRFTEKEEHVIKDLAVLQIITHKQLKKHYKLREKQIQNMLAKRLLVQHQLIKNGDVWFIYTLELIKGYKKVFVLKNYWLGYSVEDLLKQLMLTEFYFSLRYKMDCDIELISPSYPLQAIFQMNKKKYAVFIDRGELLEFNSLLKPIVDNNERLFIVTEHVNHLKAFNDYLTSSPVLYRVVTDRSIFFSNVAYFFQR